MIIKGIIKITKGFFNLLFQKSQDDAKPAIMEYRGPGGVFILTELLTSNISRTRQMLQTVLKKHK